MKRSAFRPKPELNEAQRLLREAHRDAKKRLRFGNPGRARIKSIRRQYKGIKFDSSWELECFKQLEYREKAGEIKNLQTHVVIPIHIPNANGSILKLSISIDFTFEDIGMRQQVRADAKPPKKLDGQKKDWWLRWDLMRHLEPQFSYRIYRMHSTWRDIDI